MALDHLQNSGLTRALTDLLADLAELVQKELQLAKTEITEKITSRLRASAWMVAADAVPNYPARPPRFKGRVLGHAML
jgi:hypothetical protein